ncbi:hypothetical protein CVT91_04380 [Candidatus Atribacteria bacterium HGW-Atribacteria-1]|nr:MAG: hypothetical protein CVT91_04380 [Candidatus Atribacteria bacterium HGW-Atribacteria-1]
MSITSSIKNILHVKWNPTRDTAVAFILGFLSIAVSFGLLLFSGNTTADKIGFFVLRDLIMIFCLGFAIPLYYVLFIKKESIRELGITTDKWLVSLIISIILAILLLFKFMSEAGELGQEILLNSNAIGPIFYLMVGGIYEVLFFYVFMRQRFENAFGIIPGIVLAALFCSLSHVGFQPEFLKLFFVHAFFMSVFRTTKNILIVYPFFWGVGACWDVLVSFGAMERLEDAWIKGVVVLILMIIFIIYLKWRMRKA